MASLLDNLTSLNCTAPRPVALPSQILIPHNRTNFSTWTPSEHFDYACHYAAYLTFKDFCRSIEGHLLLIWGALGFVGALGMSLTLSQSHFRPSPDFLFFRLVAYLEMIQMTVMTPMAASAFLRCETSYACSFIWAHLATAIQNVCADTVDLIVLFLCVERTVACLFPQHFRSIQSACVRRTVIVGSLGISVLFSVFQSLEVTVTYDEKEARYVDDVSEFAQTRFYEFLIYANMCRFYSTAVLIAVATLTSIFGFVKAARRKERLLRRPRSSSGGGDSETHAGVLLVSPVPMPTNTTTTTTRLSDASFTTSSTTIRLSDFNLWRRNTETPETGLTEDGGGGRRSTIVELRQRVRGNERRQREMDLCCLQLCLAIPIVVNQLLYASGLNRSYAFVVGKGVYETELSYEQAVEEIRQARSFHTLRTWTNISNVLAHALHFYLYLLFSVKVRRDFVGMIVNWYESCLKVICGYRGRPR